MRSISGNPYDGHRLENAIEKAVVLTSTMPRIVLADYGHRCAISINPAKRLFERCLVDEPLIGHMETEGSLARNGLESERGDALHAVMYGPGNALPPRVFLYIFCLFSIGAAGLDERRTDPPDQRVRMGL
jgi:IS5 family transposase